MAIKKYKFKPLWVILFLLLMLLQYQLWFQPSGILKMLALRQEVLVGDKKNEQFRQQNVTLLHEVKNIKESRQVVEGKARKELGLVKKGEKFYRVVS